MKCGLEDAPLALPGFAFRQQETFPQDGCAPLLLDAFSEGIRVVDEDPLDEARFVDENDLAHRPGHPKADDVPLLARLSHRGEATW
jgi:hypothetical protein